jgi:hypothetical protein
VPEPFCYLDSRAALDRGSPAGWVAVLWLLAGIGTVQAHSFGTPYNSPVPFWAYAIATNYRHTLHSKMHPAT